MTDPNVPLAPLRRLWLWIPCALVGLGCALVPFTGLRALGAPAWLAVAAAAVVFPVLPLVWQVLASRQGGVGPGTPLDRLALRCVALGALVVAVALASVGPQAVGERLVGLVHHPRPPAPPRPRPAAPASGPVTEGSASPRNELDTLIPADASLAVGLSGAAIIDQILASQGVDVEKGLAALGKCQVQVDRAQVLIAGRDRGARLIAVRAPGITDERNLYCLVGFLGSGRVSLRFSSEKSPTRFQVEGLFAHPLTFEATDDRTVVMVDPAWSATASKKLWPEGGGDAEGPLAAALARVDRAADLWSAGFSHTAQGSWDLALTAKYEGTQLALHATATPPAGSAGVAEATLRVPAAFLSALPAGALADGIRGLAAVVQGSGVGFAHAPPRLPEHTP